MSISERDELEEIGKRIKREMDPSPSKVNQIQMGRIRGQLVGPPGAVLNTITPCAACKLLRRRCAEECTFSPYFSPHEPHKFAAVHKIFGASNVSKMLSEVSESQRADAANSLVYEANVRLRDPIYGCMGAISSLQRQIQSLETELSVVRSEILRFKFREASNPIPVLNSSAASPHPRASLSASSAGGGAILSPPTTPPLVSVAVTSPAAAVGFGSISSASVAYFD